MKTCLAILFSCLLSITFVSAQTPALTAVFDGNKNIVSLKWQHTENNVIQYVLQRSAENVTWSDIFKEEGASFKKNKIAKYVDERPSPGKSYYRLKVIRSGAPVLLSKSIIVIMGKPGNKWLMYPVPVTTMLNLQYNGSELIPGVITVIIRTMRGQVLNRLRLASTTRLIQIPVDNLGRGTYDIQIIIKEEVVFNQRFVK